LHGPPLPATAKQRIAALTAHPRLDTLWREARDQAVAGAINPDDYECGPTDFRIWIFGKFSRIQNFDAFLDIAFNYGALDWATFYSAFVDHDGSDDYIGINGAQTQEIKKRHKDNQRFWDVPTLDVQLHGMHGADLADDSKMVPLIEFLFGVPRELAIEIVDYVQSVIESDPGLGYDNPLFTLNAFALTARGEPPGSPFAGVPDKIVMGDGIIEAMADLGLGDNAPSIIHAHEFGHHVQFELGLFDQPVLPEDQPEFTRRTELMADAFGAYYSAHARGAAFQTKRIVDALTESYLLGDCGFTFPDHHGTPNQRRAAAEWGANLAASARKQGHINSSAQMLNLFEAQLPLIVAPDAR
jgi:hypothetical protein